MNAFIFSPLSLSWRMIGRMCCAASLMPSCKKECVLCGAPPSHDESETRFALCNIPPSRTTCSVGPPRLDDAPPKMGGYDAAKIHVWVRFLLPTTTFALNAKHRSQESA